MALDMSIGQKVTLILFITEINKTRTDTEIKFYKAVAMSICWTDAANVRLIHTNETIESNWFLLLLPGFTP